MCDNILTWVGVDDIEPGRLCTLKPPSCNSHKRGKVECHHNQQDGRMSTVDLLPCGFVGVCDSDLGRFHNERNGGDVATLLADLLFEVRGYSV